MATLFKEVNYNLATLIQQIDLGIIGLPDIQRPFVWKDTIVRDLFDSMYKGYPVGYLLFWANGYQENSKTIGTQLKQKSPQLLIVDGQQRLTSLYAVIKAQPVIRENYIVEQIVISFKPLEEKFEIPDAATRRSPEYIQNISELWSQDINIFSFTQKFIENLQQSRNLTDDDINRIQEAISKLKSLEHYPFSVLELSASINEEQVADVFVRINSQGKKLNTTDFILTLMSVFWEDGRKALENFCENSRIPSIQNASAFNYIFTPDPEQMLRAAVGYGFRRARMKYVYSILRGKDLETERFSEERRDQQFAVLMQSQAKTLNITNWHEFLKAVQLAGYKREDYVISKSNIVFVYAMYLIGKYDFKVPSFELRQIIAKWFFMTSVTARYTVSPESQMEADLALLRGITTADEFVHLLQQQIDAKFTDDFWKIQLPNSLERSASRSPALFAYYASLVVLEAKGLFSQLKVSDLFDASIQSNKSALEKHHLFPKKFLEKLGVHQQTARNQIANYALVEWGDNVKISDSSPEEYVPKIIERFNFDELQNMYFWHALPTNWESMEYQEFLEVRRYKIAEVIRTAYDKLVHDNTQNNQVQEMDIESIINSAESTKVEFKSTLRVNLFTNKEDSAIENACLKTIAAFLNSAGGRLIIGVDDSGKALGLEVDKFGSEDKQYNHLANLIRERIGAENSMYIDAQFVDFQEKRVFMITCYPAYRQVYVRNGEVEHFYVRTGNSTSELTGTKAEDYILKRFRR